MPRTKTTPEPLANIEPADAPAIMPPEGVPAKVETKITYQRPIDPDRLEREQGDRYDLPAGMTEDDLHNLPTVALDPLSEFLEEWANYVGYNCVVVRLPDPAFRRMPNNAYLRPCFELERLGDTPFDPANFIGTLQMLNGGSGGVFRVWLTDPAGIRIQGAILDHIAIGDPPRIPGEIRGQRSEIGFQPPASSPQPQVKSEIEKKMEDLQERMLDRLLDNLTNPPQPLPAPTGLAALPIEDQLTLHLAKEGSMLGGVVERLTALAQSGDAVKNVTWKDRAIEAGLELAKTNPAIVERVSGTLERIIARILPDPQSHSSTTPYSPPVYAPPPPTLTQTVPASDSFTLPESPQSEPGLDRTPEEEDDELMAILEDLISLINSDAPLTLNNPILIQLQQDYPAKFNMVIGLLATQPSATVIEWVSAQSPLYESLLTSTITGPHLRARLRQLQILCHDAMTQARSSTAQAPTSGSGERVRSLPTDGTPPPDDEDTRTEEEKHQDWIERNEIANASDQDQA